MQTPRSHSEPAAFRSWRERHPLEARWLTIVDTDWPGAAEFAHRFVAQVSESLTDANQAGRLIDRNLGTGIRAYRKLLDQGHLVDRDRLQAFLEGLTADLPADVQGECGPEALILGWMPSGLGQAWSDPDGERLDQDAA
jgi:hypothetical protein